ncbi:hypothetical protein [Mesorhizobium sp. IMUNJ 23033]|uniref:hypothetical protein n=1 Tax=Mesorhizobium sp. IMUNJ 23033 TaxID=3378039 RepID=UPI0038507712
MRRRRHRIVFADITTAHRLADSRSKLFRRHVEARPLPRLGVGAAHVFQRFGQGATVPILDRAFDSEVAFASHVLFEVEAGFGQISHDRSMNSRWTMSRPQQRVETGLQRADCLAARGDAVVTKDRLFDGLRAHANAFRMRGYFVRRRDMILQSLFYRGEGGFPFGMGEQGASAGTEKATQNRAAANCHRAFGQRSRLLRSLERDFGHASTQRPGYCCPRASHQGSATNADSRDQFAAGNKRWHVDNASQSRGCGPQPAGRVDRAPIFGFHVDLSLHCFEGWRVENVGEPVPMLRVRRRLDLVPHEIPGEAILTRGQIDAGQLVRCHRANRVVLPEAGTEQRCNVWRDFGVLRRLVVDGAERAEGRAVFGILDNRH